MALPDLGKCIGILVLALLLLLYTGYAFKIRDAAGVVSTEQSKPVCNPLLGKCNDRTPVPVSLRGKQEVPVGGRKIHPPAKSDEDLQESRKIGFRSDKTVKIVERSRIQRKTVPVLKVGAVRNVVRVKVAPVQEEEEDDGVEGIGNGEMVEREDDDDDDDESEDEVSENKDSDDEQSYGVSEKGQSDEEDEEDDNDENKDENEDESDDDDDDDDDDQDDEDEDKSEDNDFDDNKHAGSDTEKFEDSENYENDDESEIEVKKEPIKSEKVRRRMESTEMKEKRNIKISKEMSNDKTAADDIKDSEEQDNHEDEESQIKDETPPPQPPQRKLEKVRLADKSKSIEILHTKGEVEVEVQTEEPEKYEVKKAEPPKVSKEPSKVKPTTFKEELKPQTKVQKEKTKPKSEEKGRKDSEKSKVKTSKEQVKETVEKSKMKSPDTMPPVRTSIKEQQEKTDLKAKKKKIVEASITLTELNDMILQVPTFLPNFTAVENPVCQKHGKIFLRQLRGFKLWALQMLDSSAKIPSGLLRGNVNQLGDFDECLGIMARVKVDDKTIKVQGKYCLAAVDLHASRSEAKVPVNLMQSRAFVRGSIHDPGHFIPRFTTLNWALCLPAACSAEDAQTVMEKTLEPYNVSSGVKFSVDVNEDMCYVQQKTQTYSKETIGVLYFYAMTFCLVLIATLRDYCISEQGKGSYSERIIMAFSLRRTTNALIRNASNKGDIRCIHGIRSLATIFLYVAHKLIPVSRMPFANRIMLTEVANNPISSVLRVSLVYTDSFLLLSGVLTAYNMAKEMRNRGEIRWFCRFVSRYIRLTPALLVVVFWYAFVMEHVGSGPQWNSIVKNNADICKRNAWTNVLYVQNFFPFEEMCATHTHQLALDMQLSLLAPMLVFFLICKPIIGILILFFLLQVSATVRYLSTSNNYLSLVIFHGITLKHLYKTANLTYALPLHRATPYLCGVGLGVLLDYTGKNIRIHKILVILGWLIASVLGGWSLFSPWKLARRDYVYDVEEATHFAVICPVSWSLTLCWTIFACFTNHGGPVNRILSSRWAVIFSRISYAVYLTQFAVFFYNVGTTRYPSEFQIHRAIDLYEVFAVILVSVVLTLVFDMPMQEVKNVIMESSDGLVIETTSEENKEHTEMDGEKEEKLPKEIGDDEVDSTGWDWQKDIAEGVSRNDKKEDTEEDDPIEIWNLKKQEVRRQSLIRRDAEDKEEIPTWDWIKGPSKRVSREEEIIERGSKGRGSQRSSVKDADEDIKRAQQQREEEFRRDRRSQSRTIDSKRSSVKDNEDPSWEFLRRERSSSRPSEIQKVKEDNARQFKRERSESKGRSIREPDENPSWEFVTRERASSKGSESKRASIKSPSEELRPMRQSLEKPLEPKRMFSSGSEEELIPQGKLKMEESYDEPRKSDEENWEEALRLRREKLKSQDVPSQEPEEDGAEWRVTRRSSAEGKIALLKDTTDIDVMNTWRIPRVSRMGSSQEPSEPEDDVIYSPRRDDYREKALPFDREETQSEEESSWDNSRRRSYTSGSQPTSLEEEDEMSSYDFVLRKESKRTSLRDLSRLDDPEIEEDSGWDLVKDDKSDSAPRSSSGLFKRESIIKSQASEEDPEYLLPERPKLVEQEQIHPFKKAWQVQKSRSEEEGPSGFLAKDTKPSNSGSTSRREDDSNDRRRKDPTGGQSKDLENFLGDERESRSQSEDNTPSLKSETDEDSSRFHWPSEDEQLASYKQQLRRRSEEANWDWEQEET